MYYCSRSKNIPYSREKIIARMTELADKIQEMDAQPYTGKVEMVGQLNLANPVTRLVVEYKALKYKFENPPDPRGDKMYSRVGPYIERAYSKDLAVVLNIHLRTAQRALKLVHDTFELKVRAWVTVDEFCYAYGLPAGEIHQNLSLQMQDRWKEIRDRLKKKEKKSETGSE